jgi:hypothetical protein
MVTKNNNINESSQFLVNELSHAKSDESSRKIKNYMVNEPLPPASKIIHKRVNNIPITLTTLSEKAMPVDEPSRKNTVFPEATLSEKSTGFLENEPSSRPKNDLQTQKVDNIPIIVDTLSEKSKDFLENKTSPRPKNDLQTQKVDNIPIIVDTLENEPSSFFLKKKDDAILGEILSPNEPYHSKSDMLHQKAMPFDEPSRKNGVFPEATFSEKSKDFLENELTLEDIFVNLTLISKIDVGNKLTHTNKHINIDTSYFQFITRWINGINRNNNLSFIRLILIKAFEFNDKLMDDSTHDTNVQLLIRLNNDLKNTINGLLNFKHTYYYDKLAQSEIDVMIDNIRSKLDLNSKGINFNKS